MGDHFQIAVGDLSHFGIQQLFRMTQPFQIGLNWIGLDWIELNLGWVVVAVAILEGIWAAILKCGGCTLHSERRFADK